MNTFLTTYVNVFLAHVHTGFSLQAEEERMAVVERDNRILLEKMSKIMRTHGQVECRNDYEYKR